MKLNQKVYFLSKSILFLHLFSNFMIARWVSKLSPTLFLLASMAFPPCQFSAYSTRLLLKLPLQLGQISCVCFQAMDMGLQWWKTDFHLYLVPDLPLPQDMVYQICVFMGTINQQSSFPKSMYLQFHLRLDTQFGTWNLWWFCGKSGHHKSLFLPV